MNKVDEFRFVVVRLLMAILSYVWQVRLGDTSVPTATDKTDVNEVMTYSANYAAGLQDEEVTEDN